jgi:poly(3-hydroxybutyrate) depolymerase
MEIPGEPCITSNGMMLLGSFDCEGFNRAEAAALHAIELATDQSDVAWRLEGARVSVLMAGDDDRDNYFRAGGQDCYGLYRMNQNEIILANDNWASNSLTHEMLHAIEGMNADHDQWEERGFLAAADLGKTFYALGIQ